MRQRAGDHLGVAQARRRSARPAAGVGGGSPPTTGLQLARRACRLCAAHAGDDGVSRGPAIGLGVVERLPVVNCIQHGRVPSPRAGAEFIEAQTIVYCPVDRLARKTKITAEAADAPIDSAAIPCPSFSLVIISASDSCALVRRLGHDCHMSELRSDRSADTAPQRPVRQPFFGTVNAMDTELNVPSDIRACSQSSEASPERVPRMITEPFSRRGSRMKPTVSRARAL